MAAIIGDVISEPGGFHGMMAPASLPHQHVHVHDMPYRSVSQSRDVLPPRSSSPHQRSFPPQSADYNTSTPRSQTPQTHQQQHQPPQNSGQVYEATTVVGASSALFDAPQTTATTESRHVSVETASRIPSPPSSSATSAATSPAPTPGAPQQSLVSTAPSSTHNSVSPSSDTTVVLSAATIPSPPSDHELPPEKEYSSHLDSPEPRASSPVPAQQTIHLRDLAHIQSLARANLLAPGKAGSLGSNPPLSAMKYDISGMPIGDIIEMIAALLTKITTGNDVQHDAVRDACRRDQADAAVQAGDAESADDAGSGSVSSSVLSFHGKNIPAITILSYLTRIHKYCPTTYEVFLSLLVYFDRMADRVNSRALKQEGRRAAPEAEAAYLGSPPISPSSYVTAEVDDDGDMAMNETTTGTQHSEERSTENWSGGRAPSEPFFVVDSYNIHRLIIAGVTCASKFFSDVFYTNSRYAKVGGLPLAELNHLELQFLLLNDIRLYIPVEDLEAYATMLVEFYVREVLPEHTDSLTIG